MADVLLQPRYTPAIGSLTIDAVLSETHTISAEVTDHPVEQGFNVTDHIRRLPDSITLECIVTDAPFDPVEGDEPPSSTAYAYLNAIVGGSELINVVTSVRTYESMAVTSISITRDARTARALKFTAQLRQVRVVENRLTRVVVARDPRAGKKVKLGAVTPANPERKKTVARRLAETLAEGGNDTAAGVGRFFLRQDTVQSGL
jgi:hypothetical protein